MVDIKLQEIVPKRELGGRVSKSHFPEASRLAIPARGGGGVTATAVPILHCNFAYTLYLVGWLASRSGVQHDEERHGGVRRGDAKRARTITMAVSVCVCVEEDYYTVSSRRGTGSKGKRRHEQPARAPRQARLGGDSPGIACYANCQVQRKKTRQKSTIRMFFSLFPFFFFFFPLLWDVWGSLRA